MKLPHVEAFADATFDDVIKVIQQSYPTVVDWNVEDGWCELLDAAGLIVSVITEDRLTEFWNMAEEI